MRNNGFPIRRNRELEEASVVTGQELSKLVDLIKRKFKIDRPIATKTAGALILLMHDQLKEDETTQADVRNIIDELSKSFEN